MAAAVSDESYPMSRDTKTPLASALTLAAVAAVCASLVAGTWHLTRNRIAANALAHLEQSLAPALGDVEYDGSLTAAMIELPPPHELPGNDAALIYRVYSGGIPAAALIVMTAEDGYSGPIRILLGVDTKGVVTGLRILEHRETPGVGDGIAHDRSNWAEQFAGRTLGDPPIGRWAIHGDGGDFDQLTGASVTPRAVIKATRDTLIYFDANRDAVFSTVPDREAP